MLAAGSRRQPVDRLLRRRPRAEPPVQVESDLAIDHPVTKAELEAIEQLLGPEFMALLAD
jgi:hypothetical protein